MRRSGSGVKEEDGDGLTRRARKGILTRPTSFSARSPSVAPRHPQATLDAIQVASRSPSPDAVRRAGSSTRSVHTDATNRALSSSSVDAGSDALSTMSADAGSRAPFTASVRRPSSKPPTPRRVTRSISKASFTEDAPITIQRVTRSSSRVSFADNTIQAGGDEGVSVFVRLRCLATNEYQIKLKRNKNVIRGNDKHDIVKRRQYTWWFETTSESSIAYPPAVHPSCGLREGDLFWHQYAGGFQFWLRVLDGHTTTETWQPIKLGDSRADGRRLTITPTKKVLSWVGGDWGNRRVSVSEYS